MAPPKRSIKSSNEKTDAASSLALGPEEVEKLLNPEGAAQARHDVARKMASAYGGQGFSAQEGLIAEQIFRLLVRDTELDIRITMAETLKSSAKLPRDIVLTMAKDVEQVALPVLTHSEVLTDMDLVALIHATENERRHNAIAVRRRISGEVSGVLVEKGSSHVLTTLAGNAGAEISPPALEQMVERHHGHEALMQNLARREQLPVTVAEKLITAVSGKLAEALQQKYRLGAHALKEEEVKARESATLALIRNHHTPDEMLRLIQQLITFRRLTPTLLVATLCQGYVDFTERALAELAGIPLSNARKLLHDTAGLGFRALYNKTSLPEEYFLAFKRLYAAAGVIANAKAPTVGTAFKNQLIESLQQRAREKGESVADVMILIRNSAE